jgi:hypothetical protein
MNKPIFSKEQFTLCEVPVPEGYPQSQTHSGVAYGGGKFYLTSSPYPVVKKWKARFRHLMQIISNGRLYKKRPESFENPCLYIGMSETSMPPVRFCPMTNNPLMSTPDNYYGLPSYNSDPDVFYEGGKLRILNRSFFRTKIYKDGRSCDSITRIYLLEGIVDGNKFKLTRNTLIREWDKPFLSPCLTKFKGRYIFTYLDTNSAIDGMTFNGLYYSSYHSLNEICDAIECKRVSVKSGNYLPWHMSLFPHNDKLFSIVACVEKGKKDTIWQMLGEFNDELSELTIYPTPLTDYNSYRGAACVNEQGMFVLYSSTLHEHIQGSKSVDGRDIVMANMPFSELLDKIKQP